MLVSGNECQQRPPAESKACRVRTDMSFKWATSSWTDDSKRGERSWQRGIRTTKRWQTWAANGGLTPNEDVEVRPPYLYGLQSDG